MKLRIDTVIRYVAQATFLLLTLVAFSNAWCASDGDSKTDGTDAPKIERDEVVLRYLPDNCRVFAHLSVKPVMASTFVQNLSQPGADIKDSLDVTLAPFGVTIDEIDRVFLGARAFVSGSPQQFVAVVVCSESVDLDSRFDVGRTTPHQKLKVGSKTVWASGNDNLVVCPVEQQVLLIGELDTIRDVLHRDGPAKLPSTCDTEWTLPRAKSHLVVSFLSPSRSGWPQFESLPLAVNVLEDVDAIGMEVEFRRDLEVNISALCENEKLAVQLSQVLAGLSAFGQLQNLDGQIPQFSKWVDSLECGVEGRVVATKMTIPHEFVQVSPFSGPTVLNELGSTVPAAPYAPPCVSGPCTPHTSPTKGVPAMPFDPYATPPSTGATYYPPPVAQPYPSAPGPYPSAPGPYQPPTATGKYPTPYGVSGYAPTLQSQPPLLKVADVIRLADADVMEEIIIRYIKNHQLEEPLSVDDLISLTHHVSTKIITTMQDLPVRRRPQNVVPAVPGVPVPVPSPSRNAMYQGEGPMAPPVAIVPTANPFAPSRTPLK